MLMYHELHTAERRRLDPSGERAPPRNRLGHARREGRAAATQGQQDPRAGPHDLSDLEGQADGRDTLRRGDRRADARLPGRD